MGVKSLYTNKPNRRTTNYPKKLIVTKVITTFLELTLTLNNFIFYCKRYLQIKRCAMGTICAPAYANIFMASFESKFIYPYIKEKVMTVLRFIDDLFMIWTDSEEELLKFLKRFKPKTQNDKNLISSIHKRK